MMHIIEMNYRLIVVIVVVIIITTVQLSFYIGDYDFGIDYKVVMHITGYDEKHAKDLINAHSKNNSGM